MPKRGGSTWKSTRNGKTKWRAAVTLIDGKRLTSKDFDKEREAVAWMRQKEAEASKGLTYDAQRTTLAVFAKDWVAMKESKGLALSTIESYTRTLDIHILPYLGRVKMGDLNAARLQAYSAKIDKDGASNHTITLAFQILHGILKHAMKLQIIGYNPVNSVEVPIVSARPASIWNETQISQFLISVQGHPHEHLYAAEIVLGCRISELLALRWSDIDWDGSVSITKQISRPTRKSNVWTDKKPKTNNGIRKIKVDGSFLDRMREQQKLVDAMRKKAGPAWEENDLIFPVKSGHPLYRNLVTMEFKKLAGSAGVPVIRFHDLRHTNISLLLKHRVKPFEVAARAGDRLATILKTYAHYIPDDDNTASEIAGSFISLIEISKTYRT